MKKKIFCMFMALVMVFAMTSIVSAAETDEVVPTITTSDVVMPRVGIAGYANNWCTGSSGSFSVSTNSIVLPSKQSTIELSNFDFSNGLQVWVEISNSNNKICYIKSFTANNKYENLNFQPSTYVNGGTYKIVYRFTKNSVPFDASGWIGVWIY